MIHFYLNSYKTPARSFAQKLLHRICYRRSANFQVIKLYLNSCKNQTSTVLLFLSGGRARRWLTNRYPLRRVGHPNVWRHAGLVCPWATLCGESCMSDGQTLWCGERRNFFARSNRLRRSCVSERPNMWWNVNFFWARATLCRGSALVGHPNMWQNANLVRPVAAPSHEMRVNRQKLV